MGYQFVSVGGPWSDKSEPSRRHDRKHRWAVSATSKVQVR